MTKRNLDALLRFVADRRRRQAIHQLRHHASGKTPIDDLVDTLRSGDSHTDDQTTGREQLSTQLYHVHLPKLADHDIVEFDPENRDVRYQPDDQIESILDSLPDETSRVRS